MSQRTVSATSNLLTVEVNEKKDVLKVVGAGQNQCILVHTNEDEMRIWIVIDNAPMRYGRYDYFTLSLLKFYHGDPATASYGLVGGHGVWLTYQHGLELDSGIVVNLPLKWTVGLTIIVENKGAALRNVIASIIYDKLAEELTLAVPKPDIQAPEQKPWWQFW